MNAKILTLLLAIPFAAGAIAQSEVPGPGGGPEGREISRECFDLALRIRRSADAAEKEALAAELREMVTRRHVERLEEGKRRIADAERAIAERHAAALRGLETVKQRVADAESHLSENIEREMKTLLGGEGDYPEAQPETPKGNAP